MARLGIKGVTFHDLRGTAITFAYANLDKAHDEKIKLISEISGHSQDDAESTAGLAMVSLSICFRRSAAERSLKPVPTPPT